MARRAPASIHVAIVLGLVLLASLFFGPRIWLDRTILVGDGFYYDDPSFRVIAPDLYTRGPANHLGHVDHGYQFYPHLHYVQTSLDRGQMPWWNPYLGLGVPEVALSGAALEPVALALGRVVPLPTLSSARAVAALAIGGYGLFLLVVTLGGSRTAGVFAAVAWAFSGWTIAWLGRSNVMAEIWMPWLLWAAERLLRAPAAPLVGAGAVFAGFACLTSHPQTSVQILATLAAYVLARVAAGAAPPGARLRRLTLVGIAVALGIAIALVQLVPMAELIGDAELPAHGRARVREAAGLVAALGYGLLGDWTVVARDLPTAVTLVAPAFLGSPVNDTYWWPGYNLMEMMVYTGVVPVFFAAYAAARGRETPAARLWLGLAVVAFGVAYALPVFNLVNYAPVLGLANNGRLRFVFRFAVVVAAAFGFDRFVADLAGRRVRWRRWLAGLAAVTVAAPAAVCAVLALRGQRWPSPGYLLSSGGGVAGVVLALAVLVALRAGGRLRPAPFRAAIVALAFADALWHLGDFNPAVPNAHVFPETPVVRFLRQDPSLYRVASGPFLRVLPANAKLPYRLHDADLFDVLNVGRYARLQETVNRYPSREDNTQRAFSLRHPDTYRGLVNLMNVKYVLVPRLAGAAVDPFAERPWYRRVYEREIHVYENTEVLPRAFVVDRAEVVTPDAALARVTRADFDPRAAVLLEDPSSPRLAPAAGGAPGTAAVVGLEANRMVVVAEASGPSYLVVSETWYPGWRARVDGTDAPVYRADYLFRAVHLPAGRHEVVFTFAPTSYRLALAGSLGGLAAAGACLGWGAVRRRAAAAR